jgi:hypothetical protein
MIGKYSPTVSKAYRTDQDWFEKYAGKDENECDNLYDPEGYDSYGYNKDGFDRVENKDYFYSKVCECCRQTVQWYDEISLEWTFDGTKPVKRI